MNHLQKITIEYLELCQYQKRLDPKTLKAYRIDLRQFSDTVRAENILSITPTLLEEYIKTLHLTYKPKTAKRKIASLKAFFHYLEYRNYIEINPFNKIHIKFREPIILPKTIPLQTMEQLLVLMYKEYAHATTNFQKKNCLRDVAVVELLSLTLLQSPWTAATSKIPVSYPNRYLEI